MTDAVEIGKFILILGTIAGGYLKIQKSIRSMAGKGELTEITPNPLPTEKRARLATMDDIDHLDKRITRIEDEHRGQHSETREWLKGLDDNVDDLRDRMDDKLARMSDTMGEMSRALGRLEGQ